MGQSKLTRSLRDQIADEIRGDLIMQRYSPGEQLIERELAARFHVSHAPVREALLILAHQGFLESTSNRSVRVASPATGSVRRMLADMRLRIELQALGTLVDALDPGDVPLWSDALAELQAACHCGQAEAILISDLRFHRTLLELAHQPCLLVTWTTLSAKVRMMREDMTPRTQQADEFYQTHERIFQLATSGQKGAALEQLESHLQDEFALTGCCSTIHA